MQNAVASKDSAVFDEQEKQFLRLKEQLKVFEEANKNKEQSEAIQSYYTRAQALSKRLARQISEVQSKLKLNQNMRRDCLNSKLNDFLASHKEFKKSVSTLLKQRLEAVKRVNCSKVIRDIEDRELANIIDIQVGDADHISELPTSTAAKSKQQITERNISTSSNNIDSYRTPVRQESLDSLHKHLTVINRNPGANMTMKLPTYQSMIEEVQAEHSDRPKQMDFSFNADEKHSHNQDVNIPKPENRSPHTNSFDDSELSPHCFGYIDLGYRPYFVYRLHTTDVIMVNDERQDFCFLEYKNYKLKHLAKVRNRAKKVILCCCESSDYLFVATQENHIYVISKSNFTLFKKIETLQLINCLTRIDTPLGSIILIGMVNKFFGTIKVMGNSVDVEEMDLSGEVGHSLSVRQIFSDQKTQSFLVSHFGKKLEYWKVVQCDNMDSRLDVIHTRHLSME